MQTEKNVAPKSGEVEPDPDVKRASKPAESEGGETTNAAPPDIKNGTG